MGLLILWICSELSISHWQCGHIQAPPAFSLSSPLASTLLSLLAEKEDQSTPSLSAREFEKGLRE